MDKLTSLLKEHHVGEWCKRAAWIIAAIGLIEIVLTVYSLTSELQQVNMSNSPPTWGTSMVYIHLVPLFATIAQVIFFFFTLYAAGVFLNHFVADTKDENEEGEGKEEDKPTVEEEGVSLVGIFDLSDK